VKQTAKKLYESTLDSNKLLSPSISSLDPHRSNKRNMIQISSRVLEAMKNEADHEASYPTSLYYLADLWMSSSCVMDLYGNPTEDEYNAERGSVDLVKSLERLSVDSVEREKALKRALRELQTSVHSIEPNITSWEVAEEKLATVLILPKDENKFDPDATQDFRGDQSSHEKMKPSRPIKKAMQSKVATTGVLDYFRLLCKSDTLHRWRSNRSNKWNHFAHFKIPAQIAVGKLVEEANESVESVTLRLDNLLKKKIEKAEYSAREKEIAEENRIEEEIRKREEEEETKKRKEEEKRKEDAEKAAASLLRPLTDEESNLVHEALWGPGPLDEKLATSPTDSVQRQSMHTLRPGEWLNDEVIHYFFLVLAKRDEALSAAYPQRKRSHFFMSFFFTKLFDEGCTNKYTYSNVKRWSKKVPGKDIFGLDKVFFPCNINMMHWTCVVIFMQEKRIQFYDSMGGDGYHYTEGLLKYLKDEWASKKGGELPDLDKWTIVGAEKRIPRQKNGYDCGVFTCMFADFLSMNRPLTFNQTHINQCRERIALSILKGAALE
jgi:sentrin-specific protease 1